MSSTILSSPGCTRDGVSSVLGAILVFAVLTTLVTSIFIYYLPILKKNAEFKHENELIDRFLEIVDGYPNCDIALKLGGGETIFDPIKTSATLETNVSGHVSLELFNGTLFFLRRVDLGCVNLTIYNTRIGDVKLVFADGGVVMTDFKRYVVLEKPNLDVRRSGRFVKIVLYNFTSKPEELAGNGFGFVRIRANYQTYEFDNVTDILVNVRDSIFSWNSTLERAGFVSGSSGWVLSASSLGYGNLSVKLTIYDVDVELY